MEEIWIEKYRPSNLSEVVGQNPVTSRLKKYVKERSMPHLIFAGPAGTTAIPKSERIGLVGSKHLTNNTSEQIEIRVG
ncbi:MAG: hypothetical protein VYE80_00035, partial [Candidatus Thermoplasmatota archaeon]|nr:hypothetical protein [Candidatus Thermoplasmatota archaeon]